MIYRQFLNQGLLGAMGMLKTNHECSRRAAPKTRPRLRSRRSLAGSPLRCMVPKGPCTNTVYVLPGKYMMQRTTDIYIYIYIHMYVCMYVCMYTYIYIYVRHCV